MSGIRKYVELIESAESAPLYEGVKIGKKEIEETLKHSQDFQMGIEYEFLTPNPSNRDQEATDFINQYNISHVDKIEREHDDMMEVVTTRMDIVDGLEHIKYFFKSANSYGITFPEMTGMHISISHKNAKDKDFNYTKFMVLISGGYLHSIFPERGYVENIDNELATLLTNTKPKTVGEVENTVNNMMKSGSSRLIGKKYITTKLSDYTTHDGRIELRFFGGKNYNTMYGDIRNQLLRAIYILSIALDDSMYRKEYLTQLGKLITNSHDIDSQDAFEILERKNASPYRKNQLEDIISRDAIFSFKYATEILKDRFEKGEDAISTNAVLSARYAIEALKDRFEKGEDAISTDADFSFKYAKDALKDRFEKGEDVISTDAMFSTRYAIEVLKGRFEKGEDVISTDAMFSTRYAKDALKGRFEKGEDTIATSAVSSIDYARDVIKGRFEQGEDTIATSTSASLFYVSEVLKGSRFIKGEELLKHSDSEDKEEYYELTGIQL